MRTWPRTIPTAAAGVLGLMALALSTASPGEALPLGLQPDAAPPALEAVPPKLISADDAATAETPPTSDPVAHWRPYSEEASRRFGVPLAWIERVIRAESGGRTTLAGRPIVSRAGAMGLMQLMPGAWADMRASYGLGPDPFEPRDNILAGTAYLAAMYRRFGYPGLFGAYNAGPARYEAWLAGRGALPSETRVYLARLTRDPAPPRGARRNADAAATGDSPVATVIADRSPRERLFAVERSAAVLAAPSARVVNEAQDGQHNGLFVALSNAASPAPGD